MRELTDKFTVLLIEDDEGDAFLIKHLLRDTYDFESKLEVSETLASGLERLGAGGIDVVLLDLGLPDSLGIKTFERLVAAYPDVPVVIMTGHDDSLTALEALRKGAQDYVIKGRIIADSLLRTIRYSVERKKLNVRLEKALREVKALQGLLPICAHCKNIRNDQGYWQQIEEYLGEHSLASFSHGLCPDCARKLYPEYFKTDEDTKEK